MQLVGWPSGGGSRKNTPAFVTLALSLLAASVQVGAPLDELSGARWRLFPGRRGSQMPPAPAEFFLASPDVAKVAFLSVGK